VHELPHAAATPAPTQLPLAHCVFPAAHAVAHAVPSQVGTDPGTPLAQRVQAAPHAVTSVDGTHCPPQGLKPPAQLKAQASFTQVGVPPSGAVQTLHDGPHALGEVRETHAPPQPLKPGLQAREHWP
jgi:hypothetical protein